MATSVSEVQEVSRQDGSDDGLRGQKTWSLHLCAPTTQLKELATSRATGFRRNQFRQVRGTQGIGKSGHWAQHGAAHDECIEHGTHQEFSDICLHSVECGCRMASPRADWHRALWSGLLDREKAVDNRPHVSILPHKS